MKRARRTNSKDSEKKRPTVKRALHKRRKKEEEEEDQIEDQIESEEEKMKNQEEEDDESSQEECLQESDPTSVSGPGSDMVVFSRRPLSPYQPPPSQFVGANKGEKEKNKSHTRDEENWTISDCSSSFEGPKNKPGIIYLSSIPPGFNVSRTTEFFAQFGQVGRVFLQPDMREKLKSRDGMARNFVEGWVEFVSKRVAKDVANNLNGRAVGGKKRSKAHDVLWNIKYLSKFKWTHLTERLAYEKAVHHQKMRTEISKAKKEAEHFKANVERANRKRKNNKEQQEEQQEKMFEYRQNEPDEVAKKRKRKSDVVKSPKSPPVTSKKGGKGKVKKSSRGHILQNVFGEIA